MDCRELIKQTGRGGYDFLGRRPPTPRRRRPLLPISKGSEKHIDSTVRRYSFFFFFPRVAYNSILIIKGRPFRFDSFHVHCAVGTAAAATQRKSAPRRPRTFDGGLAAFNRVIAFAAATVSMYSILPSVIRCIIINNIIIIIIMIVVIISTNRAVQKPRNFPRTFPLDVHNDARHFFLNKM